MIGNIINIFSIKLPKYGFAIESNTLPSGHKYSNNNDELGDAFGIFKAGVAHGRKNDSI